MFPVVILLVKLDSQAQFVGIRSVPRNICLLWNPSRWFTWWAHIAFFCVCVWYPSSSFQEGGGRRRKGGRQGGERGRSPSLWLKEDGKHFYHDSDILDTDTLIIFIFFPLSVVFSYCEHCPLYSCNVTPFIKPDHFTQHSPLLSILFLQVQEYTAHQSGSATIDTTGVQRRCGR